MRRRRNVSYKPEYGAETGRQGHGRCNGNNVGRAGRSRPDSAHGSRDAATAPTRSREVRMLMIVTLLAFAGGWWLGFTQEQ